MRIERSSHKLGHTQQSMAALSAPLYSDLLHPWRYITGALGSGRLIGHAKRRLSRLLYEHLGRSYPQAEWTTMNYGYAATDQPFPAIAVDDPERFALQLYWYIASLGSQTDTYVDREVLEIGSGRGGGAAFLARSLKPKTLVGLDFSSSATALARARYQRDGSLEYVQGDAENLLFEADRFDLVLNVESAHCYGSLPRFVSEVHRVLRPGGELLFTDFVSKRNAAQERLQTALTEGELQLVRLEDITPNVVRALELDEARKRDLLDLWVSGPFKTFARGAYAMQGTAMRRELESGQTVYLAAVLRKEDTSWD